MAYNNQLIADMRKHCGGDLTPAQRDAKNMQLYGLVITGGELARLAMIRTNMPTVLSIVQSYLSYYPSMRKYQGDIVGDGLAQLTWTVNHMPVHSHPVPTQYIYTAIERRVWKFWRDSKIMGARYIDRKEVIGLTSQDFSPYFAASHDGFYDCGGLDPLGRQILDLWQNGYTEREIAAKLNVSKTTIHNILVAVGKTIDADHKNINEILSSWPWWRVKLYKFEQAAWYIIRDSQGAKHATSEVNREVADRLAKPCNPSQERPKQVPRPNMFITNQSIMETLWREPEERRQRLHARRRQKEREIEARKVARFNARMVKEAKREAKLAAKIAQYIAKHERTY